MDCSPPGSSVLGLLQARTLDWVATPFARGYSNPGLEPHLLSLLHCRRILYPLSHLASLSTSTCGSNTLQVVSNLLSNACKVTLH